MAGEWPRPTFGLSINNYNQIGKNLNNANQLLGQSAKDRTNMVWPPRQDWGTEFRTARKLRVDALNLTLKDIGEKSPHLKPFTTRFEYKPGAFGVTEKSRGHTGGWRSVPGQPSNKLPFTELNDRAFRDTQTLQRTVRHEVWHRIQREHPQVYSGSQRLREFDAYLRDMENRLSFGLNNEDKFIALQQSTINLNHLKHEPAWNKLHQIQRENFSERYEKQRRDICNELRGTSFSTHPDYSRICKPKPFDPLQQAANRIMGLPSWRG